MPLGELGQGGPDGLAPEVGTPQAGVDPVGLEHVRGPRERVVPLGESDVVAAPDDVLEECSGPGGQAVDLGTPSVLDNCDVDPMVVNDAPASFPLGSTLVTWTCRPSR